MARMRAKALTNTNSLVADWVTYSLLKGLRTAIGDVVRSLSINYELCGTYRPVRGPMIMGCCNTLTIEASTAQFPQMIMERGQGRVPAAGLAC